MKRFLAFALLASALMVSCADNFKYKSEATGFGTLSFAGLQITVDQTENIVRAAEAAPGTYLIYIYDAEGVLYNGQPYSYSTILNGGTEGIALPAGTYRMDIRSEEEVPAAKFATPVYGTSVENITITAGQTTTIGQVVCTLLQCKVTVDYNDDFLDMVAGECTTIVTIGESLEYAITWDQTNGVITEYEQEAGYFAVNNGSSTTMEVKFSGAIYDEESESVKIQRMTKAIDGIEARQWRKIEFIKKIDLEGNATFDIVINDYVEDNPLNEDLTGSEEAIGSDPNAPKGDGNIKLLATAGLNDNTSPTLTAWNASFTDDEMDTETYEAIVLDDNLTSGTDADGNPTQLLQFEASVPNKIKDFYVVIESETISPLLPALIGDAEYIDLVHDTTAVKAIADVVPFPYHDPDNGVIIAGATSVAFNLDKAVGILRAMGNAEHTFKMTVRDEAGYTKQIDLKFQVVAL